MRSLLVLAMLAALVRAELSCVSCDPGFYLDQGSVSCRACPEHSTSPLFANLTSHLGCVCSPGYADLHGTACEPCATGSFKTDIGNHTCVLCSEHSTTLGPAGASQEECVCLPGFQQSHVAHACEPCAAGLFKDSISDSNCSICAADAYCPAQSLLPVACPYASAAQPGAQSVYDCACDAGFYHLSVHPPDLPVRGWPSPSANGTIFTCQACPPGTFNNESGQAACAPCPADTYYDRTAAVEEAECALCQSFAFSAPGSRNTTDCLCRLGYAGRPGEPCVPCAAGTFRNTLAEYICEACPPGTYNDYAASVDAADCRPCAANQESAGASGSQLACVCARGYFRTLAPGGLRWECSACAAGSYQDTANASACHACPTGSFSPATAATAADTCEQCADGSYALAVGASSCALCPASTWQEVADPGRHSLSCTACPGNSSHARNGSTDVHDCVCAPGFYKDAASTPFACRPCAAGHFCPGDGVQLPCPLDSWSYAGVNAGPCQWCAALSHAVAPSGSMTGPHMCQCRAGTEGSYDANCSLCLPGYAQPLNISHLLALEHAQSVTCAACPAGTYMPAAGASACLECPAFSFSSPASSDLADCACVAGFYGRLGNCTECPADHYCAGGLPAPQPCRMHSNAPPRSAEAAHCACDAGWVSASPIDSCKKCAPGYFCPGGLLSSACPQNASSLPASQSVADCSCVGGTWRNCIQTRHGNFSDALGQACVIDWTRPCVQCAANDICINNTLVHCSPHSSSEPGEEHCHCDDGFYST